jgi:hypothetical protein
MSTLSVGTIRSNDGAPPVIQNSSQTQIGTFCRAWVNFSGVGTVSIRSSFNVSTITDNGTGDYTINLTTAMADANYAAVATSTALAGTALNSVYVSDNTVPRTTSALRIACTYIAGGSIAAQDPTVVSVAIFS